jgi:hypothetical protein
MGKEMSSNDRIAYCNYCGATGPWEGYISDLNREEDGFLKKLNFMERKNVRRTKTHTQ